MVELKYDESKNGLKLPKNIRQIGKTQGQSKIYVEDYVITFLNQLSQMSPMEPKLAILLGYTVNKEDAAYVFVHGAVEASGVNIQEDHIGFTSGIWSKIYEDIKNYFGDVKVAGWFLTRPGKALKVTEKIRKIHADNFPGENKVLFVIDPLDNDEAFYIYRQGELVHQEGYCIYYERNEEMQNYMIENKKQREAKDLMNQVFIEDTAETEGKNRKTKKDKSGKVAEADVKRKTERLLKAGKKLKADKKALAGEQAEHKAGDYHKMMSGMTKYAAMVLLLVVAVAGVAAVQARNGETFPFLGRLTGRTKDSSYTESLAGDQTQEDGVATPDAMEANASLVDNSVDGQSGADTGMTEDGVAAVGDNAGNGSNVADGTSGTSDSGNGTAGSASGTSDSAMASSGTGNQTADVPVSAQPGTSYMIQDGDTLAAISRRFYNDYGHVEDICEVNGIEDANKIYPGMTILLPAQN